ncbi:hypothetical protein LXL04_011248 [Taraxacum kok-saghyz]
MDVVDIGTSFTYKTKIAIDFHHLNPPPSFYLNTPPPSATQNQQPPQPSSPAISLVPVPFD